MSDPWFRILVSSGGSKGGHGGHEGPLGAYRFESHPLVVSIPQATLNKFIEFDENVEGAPQHPEVLFVLFNRHAGRRM